jgi:hypothetical protein
MASWRERYAWWREPLGADSGHCRRSLNGRLWNVDLPVVAYSGLILAVRITLAHF